MAGEIIDAVVKKEKIETVNDFNGETLCGSKFPICGILPDVFAFT